MISLWETILKSGDILTHENKKDFENKKLIPVAKSEFTIYYHSSSSSSPSLDDPPWYEVKPFERIEEERSRYGL